MSTIVGFSATASVKIPYHITYRCSACQAENVDDSQGFAVKKRASDSFGGNARVKASTGLMDKLQEEVQERQRQIDIRDYTSLDLHCKCSACGKAQLWSDYWPVGGSFRVIGRFFKAFNTIGSTELKAFLAFLMFLGVIFVGTAGVVIPALGILLLCLLFLPSIVAMVYDLIRSVKAHRLLAENEPKIQIVRPDLP